MIEIAEKNAIVMAVPEEQVNLLDMEPPNTLHLFVATVVIPPDAVTQLAPE
jgi:hypothetical protein